MEAFEVTSSRLLYNYQNSMWEWINTYDADPEDVSEEIILLASRLKDLTCDNDSVVVNRYRKLMQEGYAARILPTIIFERIEQLYHTKKDFCIIINNTAGDHIGVIAGKDLKW